MFMLSTLLMHRTFPHECRYDVEAVRMVRRFKGHKDRVTGLVISQDARWLLSSSMDGTVRVWDIPAASCLQVTLLAVHLKLVDKAVRFLVGDCVAVHT